MTTTLKQARMARAWATRYEDSGDTELAAAYEARANELFINHSLAHPGFQMPAARTAEERRATVAYWRRRYPHSGSGSASSPGVAEMVDSWIAAHADDGAAEPS